jgi:hypothetical protein
MCARPLRNCLSTKVLPPDGRDQSVIEHPGASWLGVMPRASPWAFNSFVIDRDSRRHSVRIIRASLRPARLSVEGAASRSYFPLRNTTSQRATRSAPMQ